MLDPFSLPFVQRGLAEVLLLAVGAGLLGTWIVLRGLAFYTHAVGTAAFPGLVVADGLGFAAPLGALGAAAIFAATVGRLARRGRDGYDSLTALVLVGALALGVILASDVFRSGAHVESLLFGSLLAIGTGDVVLAAAVSALSLGTTLVLGRHWLATGFDQHGARTLGVNSAITDAALLALVALVSVAALSAVGALLATALLVVPAATARLWTQRLGSWQLASIALVALEGTVGLWLSVKFNAPPGATIAVLASAVFGLAAALRALPLRARRHVPTAPAGAMNR
ncbi:MAG TPA: metal ABC transporter permease [Solirubrobacteraceae bacterium]|nr:metal ABC transporter permease [Solirubrobacteraceae bacterium]